MAIKLNKVNNPEGTFDTVDVPFGDEVMVVKYSRQDFTPRLERELREQLQEQQVGAMFKTMLLKLLKAWDVVDVHPDDVDKPEDKQRMVPVPLNEQTFDEMLSIGAAGAIVTAIQRKNSPNQETSTTTDDTF